MAQQLVSIFGYSNPGCSNECVWFHCPMVHDNLRPATDPYFPYFFTSSLFSVILVELAGECSLDSTQKWLLAPHWPQHIMESILGEYFSSFYYQSLRFPTNIQLRDFAPFLFSMKMCSICKLDTSVYKWTLFLDKLRKWYTMLGYLCLHVHTSLNCFYFSSCVPVYPLICSLLVTK